MQCFPITSHHTRLPFLHFLNVYPLLLTHKIEHCLWHLLYLHLLDLMLSQLLYSVPQGPDPLPFRVLSAAETEEHQSLIQTNSIKVITHYNTSLFTFCLILFYVFLLVYNLFGIKQGPERLTTLQNSWPHFIRNEPEPRSAAGQSCVKDGNFISHRIKRRTASEDRAMAQWSRKCFW